MAVRDEVIGTINPEAMSETDAGLYVEGQLNLKESKVAREAWRSIKRGSVGLSFGFLVERDRKATDGVRELFSVDLFEVSITPSPANADTRILSTKSSVLTAQEHHDQELLKILQRPFVPDPVEAKTAKATPPRSARIRTNAPLMSRDCYRAWSDGWMKVGPDADAGVNLMPLLWTRWVPRVAPAPTASVFNCVARTRHGCLKPLADEAEPVGLHDAAGVLRICRTRVVVQPREDADRVGM